MIQLENTPLPIPRSRAASSKHRTIYTSGIYGHTYFITIQEDIFTYHSPALYPLTPITTLLKTFSVSIVFTLGFPLFLRILVSAPGTEKTTIISAWSCKETVLQPEVESSRLVSASICCCALELEAKFLPVPGVSDPAARKSVGQENLQGSIKYQIMLSGDDSCSHKLLKDMK